MTVPKPVTVSNWLLQTLDLCNYSSLSGIFCPGWLILLPWRWKEQVPSKIWSTATRQNVVTSHMIVIFKVTATSTQNLPQFFLIYRPTSQSCQFQIFISDFKEKSSKTCEVHGAFTYRSLVWIDLVVSIQPLTRKHSIHPRVSSVSVWI